MPPESRHEPDAEAGIGPRLPSAAVRRPRIAPSAPPEPPASPEPATPGAEA